MMSRQLIEDELREGRLVQPFGPEMEGKPFHLVYRRAVGMTRRFGR